MGSRRAHHSIWNGKLIFTFVILLGYLIGRKIPLYGIDTSAYVNTTMDVENMLMQAISGDRNKCSLLALGVSPYIISSIGMQIVMSFLGKDFQKQFSARRLNAISSKIMLGVALVQATSNLRRLDFVATGWTLYVAGFVAVVEMVAGAFVILWLAERNKRYGIGGQTLFIYINILDGLLQVSQQHTWEALMIPGIVSLFVIVVILFMENTEVHIPMQRISIYNIYSDQNYMAFKFNPIGVMPVMYASALFTVPTMVVELLASLFPNSPGIAWVAGELSLKRPLGIAVYLIGMLILTLFFSNIFINPTELAEQLLKVGDSVTGLSSGKETGRYFRRVILRLSILSAFVLGCCLGIPMVLSMKGIVQDSLAMLPSSVMMLTGIFCSLYQEVRTIRSYDSYRTFI